MADAYKRIEKFNAAVPAELKDLKYQAMAENIFRFYRGTCHLFYEDMANSKGLPLSPLAWICGDLHLENFGSYKGDNRLVYFDLNDFDEGVLAPANWEIARMLTSIFLAFNNLGIEDDKAFNMAKLFLKSYSSTLAMGKPISIDPRTADGIVCDFLNSAAKRKEKDLLKKRTEESKKKKLILSSRHEKHFELNKSLRKALEKHMNDWISTSSDGPYNFKVVNCLFRLAGTGSIGVKRYLFLLRSLKNKKKYILIDMKQSRPSSLTPYLKVKQPSWTSDADRIINIQQRMQNTLPALLGTTVFKDEAYVLEEMQPTDDRINFEVIKDDYRDIYRVIDDMAILTASAQLRSSGRQGSAIADKLIAFGLDTKWQDDLLQYAVDYARQVKADYDDFMRNKPVSKPKSAEN